MKRVAGVKSESIVPQLRDLRDMLEEERHVLRIV